MNSFSFRKTACIRLLLLVGLLCATNGFGASKRSSISLEVDDKTEKSETEGEEFSEDGNGDEVSTTTESETEICTLTIRIQNKGEQSQGCLMEWYFVSEQMNRDEPERVVFESGKKELELPVGAVIDELVVAKPFVFTTVTKDLDDVDDKETGDVYDGYIVLLTSKGEILTKAASSSRYLKPEWLDKCSRARRLMSL